MLKGSLEIKDIFSSFVPRDGCRVQKSVFRQGATVRCAHVSTMYVPKARNCRNDGRINLIPVGLTHCAEVMAAVGAAKPYT